MNAMLLTWAVALAAGLFLFTGTTTSPSFAAPPPSGACCNSNGCCSSASLVQPQGGVPNCFQATQVECGSGNFYQGDGTLCEVICATTTTTTLPSVGACCLSGGGCNDLSEKECNGVGVHAGVGSECEFTKCALPTTTTTTTTTSTTSTTTTTLSPTTTTLPATTTTTVDDTICGDANSDGNISAPDALLALKTAVGSGACSLARCDYNGDGDVSASDALAILKKAVGQMIPPMCPN